MAAIRANSVLPARREAAPAAHRGRARARRRGRPAAGPRAVATIVCLHPLPTHGGMMDSHVFRKAAFRLHALAGVAVLRFNTRGTSSAQGTSQGEFDHARGGAYDVAAAIEYAEFHDLRHLGRRLVVRHRPHADARQRPGREGRDPALAPAAVLRRGAPRGVGRVRQAADRAGAGARRPAAARGRGAVRDRPAGRGGRGRVPSTCGSATPRRCSTRSSAGSRRRSPYPCPGVGGRDGAASTSAYNDKNLAAFKDVPCPDLRRTDRTQTREDPGPSVRGPPSFSGRPAVAGTPLSRSAGSPRRWGSPAAPPRHRAGRRRRAPRPRSASPGMSTERAITRVDHGSRTAGRGRRTPGRRGRSSGRWRSRSR